MNSLGRTIAGQINLKPMASHNGNEERDSSFMFDLHLSALNLVALQSTFKVACHGLFRGEIETEFKVSVK